MTFYEVAAASTTHGQESAIRITTPSAHVIYLLTFTSSLSALSRLCAILATYKRAFEGAMGAVRGSDGEGLYPRDRVNHFNGFLMDICNCVWRNRAFNREDVNALGCLIPESILPSLRAYAEDMGHSLPTMFSLSHSTTLCALSIACFRELEDAAADEIMTRHAGPVTQRGLSKLANEGGLKISWSNYRLEVLQWLEARGVRGVAELMYNTMKHLMLNKAGSGAPVGGAESAVS
ncbi:MAG: hypothetical protein M1832_003086 [Thelocarpon impressellum]|nr:MAG: hypothetical protein M1832_003086 [Thelocarpon impressellum]